MFNCILLIVVLFIFILYNHCLLNNNNHKCPKHFKILVTGSSSNHYSLLRLMLYRILVTENNICVVVWDLGLSCNQYLELIESEKYITKIRKDFDIFNYKFNYSNYPTYFDINKVAGSYAWKPFVIYDTYNMFKRNILWLDAGCFIKNSLTYEFNEINRIIFWSLGSKTPIKKYTHQKVFEILDTELSIYNKPMCSGGVIGLFYPSLMVNKIMNLWMACALIKNCISPKGSSLYNHRYDQSVISILLYKYNFSCEGRKQKNFITHFDSDIGGYNDEGFKKYIAMIKKLSLKSIKLKII